jgi:hypothetical protein
MGTPILIGDTPRHYLLTGRLHGWLKIIGTAPCYYSNSRNVINVWEVIV